MGLPGVRGTRLNAARVLLGLLVLWQLAFMVGSNFHNFLEDVWSVSSEGHPGGAAHRSFREVFTAYEQLTGQEQGWALFWSAERETGFIAVQLRWDDQPSGPTASDIKSVLLLSDNEPRSLASYFRWGHFRTRRVESELEPYSCTAAALERHVRHRNDLMHAYLQWRLRHFVNDPEHRHLHRGLDPKQVILVFRRYRIRPMDASPPYLEGPSSMLLARWRPQLEMEPGYLPVEAYDPIQKEFVRLQAHE